MTTYAEQVSPYINFTSEKEMDHHFNLLRKKFRYEFTQSEIEVLFALKGHAAKFPGACKIALETIAEVSGYSLATVKRAVSKAVKLGILKRFNTRKANGRLRGVNIYQFQQFSEPLVEPLTLSCRENDEKPCERKSEQPKNEAEALISLSTNKSFKDTNITEQAHSEKQAFKESVLKDALLAKLPKALNALQLFFDRSQEIYDLAGVIFRSKLKGVQIEQHERLFRKTIKSVYEYWQRQIRNGKHDYNVFGLMTKAIRELCEKIVSGTAYEQPVAAPTPKLENVPDWMNVDADKFNSRELVPDWMESRNEVVVPAPVVDDFEAMRAAAQARLLGLKD